MKYEITKKKRRIPASHTPTPWTCGDPFTFDASEFENRHRVFIGIGNGAEHIGYVSVTGCVPMAEAKANAAFIVRAVNCHDDLLATLKASLDAVRYYDEHEGCPVTLQLVQAAINKAEGK